MVRAFDKYTERELSRLWRYQARRERRHHALAWGMSTQRGDKSRETKDRTTVCDVCESIITKVGIRVSANEVGLITGYPRRVVTEALISLYRDGRIRILRDDDYDPDDGYRRYGPLDWTPEAEAERLSVGTA